MKDRLDQLLTLLPEKELDGVLISVPDTTPHSLMPNAESLDATATAIYEWLGLIWYRAAYF